LAKEQEKRIIKREKEANQHLRTDEMICFDSGLKNNE
jgi:hypothetical protein